MRHATVSPEGSFEAGSFQEFTITCTAGYYDIDDTGSIMDAAAQALSNFSCACAALKDHVVEIDVNPVVVTETGAVAVDALIVPVTIPPAGC